MRLASPRALLAAPAVVALLLLGGAGNGGIAAGAGASAPIGVVGGDPADDGPAGGSDHQDEISDPQSQPEIDGVHGNFDDQQVEPAADEQDADSDRRICGGSVEQDRSAIPVAPDPLTINVC